jgi:hypothetical protein
MLKSDSPASEDLYIADATTGSRAKYYTDDISDSVTWAIIS